MQVAGSYSAAEVRWQDYARCGGTRMNFVPDRETVAELNAVRTEFCNLCPVRLECLAYAFLYRAKGYWGGTSTEQRTLLSYARNRVKCPVCKCKSVVVFGPHQICQGCGQSWTRTGTEGEA